MCGDGGSGNFVLPSLSPHTHTPHMQRHGICMGAQRWTICMRLSTAWRRSAWYDGAPQPAVLIDACVCHAARTHQRVDDGGTQAPRLLHRHLRGGHKLDREIITIMTVAVSICGKVELLGRSHTLRQRVSMRRTCRDTSDLRWKSRGPHVRSTRQPTAPASSSAPRASGSWHAGPMVATTLVPVCSKQSSSALG